MDQPGRQMPKWLLALLQSALAGLFVLGAFFAVLNVQSKLAIGSLAASAFIAFCFPKADSASPRHMLGGYACGVVCGGACCFVLHALAGLENDQYIAVILFCALAVLLCTFSMIMLNFQHPPAAALAVGMVLERDPILMGLAMLGCVAVLSALKWAFVKLAGRHIPWDN